MADAERRLPVPLAFRGGQPRSTGCGAASDMRANRA